jgi:hypothetical protein
VLTGSAIGVLLLYLMQEGLAATGQRRRGGRIDDLGDDDPGRLRARVGRIDIRPLDTIEVDSTGRRLQGFDDLGASRPASGAGLTASDLDFIKDDLEPLSIPAGRLPFVGRYSSEPPAGGPPDVPPVEPRPTPPPEPPEEEKPVKPTIPDPPDPPEIGRAHV